MFDKFKALMQAISGGEGLLNPRKYSPVWWVISLFILGLIGRLVLGFFK